MKFPRYVYQENESGGDASGTGGTSNNRPSFDPNSDEVKSFLQSQINSAVAGLKAKNEELISEKKAIMDKFAALGDVDPKVLQTYVDRIKNDEEAKLISEGRIDDVINRRTERMREALTGRIEETSKQLKEWEEKFNKVAHEYDNTRIDFAIRDAALEAKVTPTALQDVLVRARREFFIDDKGNILSRDPVTEDVRIGPDGKTPYSPKDFMVELEKSAPHFWPQNSSGNLTGAFGTASDVEQAMRAAIASGDMRKYRELRDKAKGNK